MPTGLVRYHQTGHQHFVTFSCYQRKPFLGSAAARALFERSLETTRSRYGFLVIAYVVMPEHVHLLMTEPEQGTVATVIQAIKISVSRQSQDRPFWQRRYYDFNVVSERKRVEKLQYIHSNPVTRGLAEMPEKWAWSSYRHYVTGEAGRVTIESWWTRQKLVEIGV
jgi:putative transposase